MLSFDKIILGFKMKNLKSSFNYKARMVFYRNLYVLLRNNMQVDEILKRFVDVYSNGGKKPKAPLALIAGDISAKLNSGVSLNVALQPWVPYQEMMMVKAGEESSKLTETIVDIIKIMKKQKLIVNSIMKASIYPGLLMFAASYVMIIIAQRVVPRLSRVSDIDKWPPVSILLMHISNFINNYGKEFVVCLFLFCAFIAWTIPNWSRRLPGLRIKMDNIAPYSLYRVLHGATFLMNLSVMLKAQIQLVDILGELKSKASPWLKDRIDAVQYNIELGSSLGKSLQLSGYEFPDRQAVIFLEMLSDASGSEDSVYQYAEDWLDDAVDKVDRIGSLFLGVGLVFIGVVIVLILNGVQGMADAIVK